MNEEELFFTLFYIFLCILLIYPPKEFIILGLYTDNFFSKFLGLKENDYIKYHIRRTSLNLFIHSSMPFIYFLIFFHQFSGNHKYEEFYTYNRIILFNASVLAIAVVLPIIIFWSLNSWENHPISKKLKKYSNSDFTAIASDIGREVRRSDIFSIKVNSITTLLATENWIIKEGPYTLDIAHQSDTTLHVNKSENYTDTQTTFDIIQIINIVIKPERNGVREFHVRIKAFDFKTLQDYINKPITIAPDIQFHKNLIDRFVDVFKDYVNLNMKVEINNIADSCLACMQKPPNVKIQKLCSDLNEDGHNLPEDERCRNCYCKPLWCDECLARWFAAKQNEYEKETWLNQKCSCPMCRAKFCILDVCYIK